MRPAILLTGKTGQVGFELNRSLPQLGQVCAPDHRDLDLLNPESVRCAIRDTRPQLIVNAAAYTAVDAAENDESKAYAINAEAPALLAAEAKRVNALLVHYSTDYVFDGAKRSPYFETDETNPLNVYGKSKLAGEQAIRASGASYLIFRTAWVYANRGRNFLLTILCLATEREELRIVCDQIGAPTCAGEIAAATSKILTDIQLPSKSRPFVHSINNTYHLTAAGETSWYGFAKAILDKAPGVSPNVPWFLAATRGRPFIAQRVLPISSEEFHSPTRRPIYSVLSNSRLSRTFHVTMPDWATQLQSCLASMNTSDLPLGSSSARGVRCSTPGA
jgi:dTDP-4-dehydrorhamnose reductase